MEQEIKQLMQQLKPEFLAFVKLWNWFRTEFETETLWSIDDAVEKHEDFTIGRFAHYYTKKNPDNSASLDDLRGRYYRLYNMVRCLEPCTWVLDIGEQRCLYGISRYLRRVSDLLEYIYRIAYPQLMHVWSDLVADKEAEDDVD